jgi:hypothetical protein
MKKILAFVHIEKAAGSSLIHLLRYNFPLTHCDVKPLTKDASRVFSSSDMENILRINPFVKSISGHSITPSSDLRGAYPNITYITLLRDPVERYISHYRYWVDVMGYEGNMQNFMASKKHWNFQVKKIAGVEDIGIAKDAIDKEFLLVGLMEEFAEFLVVLRKKIYPEDFKLHNYHLNKGKESKNHNRFRGELEHFLPSIKERNNLDIELYNYVKEKWAREKRNYGPSFIGDLEKLKRQSWNLRSLKWNINFLYRNLYYKNLIGFLRVKNGRKIRGGY